MAAAGKAGMKIEGFANLMDMTQRGENPVSASYVRHMGSLVDALQETRGRGAMLRAHARAPSAADASAAPQPMRSEA